MQEMYLTNPTSIPIKNSWQSKNRKECIQPDKEHVQKKP